jgi:hypothetical protein
VLQRIRQRPLICNVAHSFQVHLFVICFESLNCKTISALPIVPSCFSVLAICELPHLYDVIKCRPPNYGFSLVAICELLQFSNVISVIVFPFRGFCGGNL